MLEKYSFVTPNNHEFEQVKQLVEEFWLDDSDMKPEQFQVILDNGNVIAFGRLREHSDATELCTIGVAKEFQGKGWGEKMVKELIHQSKGDVFLVTVIPDFFKKFGFSLTETYPPSIKQKAEICSSQYHTGEQYYIMKWEKQQ